MQILTVTLVLNTLVSTTSADLDAGRELRRAGKLEEAIALFEESLASDPASLEARRELGHCLALAERYSEAIEMYGNLGASQELRWQLEAAKWIGLTHLYLGNIEASLEQSRRQARLANQLGESAASARSMRDIGYVYAELEQFGQANTAFIAALNGNSNDLDTLYLVAVLAVRQGDWGSLRYQILDLEPLVTRAGNSDMTSRIDHLKAEVALARGDAKAATDLLRKTGSMHVLYRETLARVHRHRNDLAQAEATYRSILHSTDGRLEFPILYVKALLGMANVLEAQKRPQEAASFLRRFLEHWGDAGSPLPGVADARNRLERLEAQP